MIQHDILVKTNPTERMICNEIKKLRIDLMQAEMHRLGVVPDDVYANLLVNKINRLDREVSEDEAELAEITGGIMKKDGV